MTDFEQKKYDELKKKCKSLEDDNKLLRDLLTEFSKKVEQMKGESGISK